MQTKTAVAPRPTDGSYIHWRLAGTIIWGVVLAVVFVVVQAVVALFFILRGQPGLSDEEVLILLDAAQSNGTVLAMSTLASALICVPLFALVIKLKRSSNISDYLALRGVPAKSLMRWLGILVVFMAISDALTIAMGRPVVTDFMHMTYASANPLWAYWLALVLAAPLLEEVFFRGFVFKGLASSFIGPYGAIVATAVLWAVIHLQYDYYGIGTILVLGILLGAARLLTGSLFVPLAMHALSNVVATTEVALLR